MKLKRVLDTEMRALSERALGSLSEKEKSQFVRFLRELRTNVARPQR